MAEGGTTWLAVRKCTAATPLHRRSAHTPSCLYKGTPHLADTDRPSEGDVRYTLQPPAGRIGAAFKRTAVVQTHGRGTVVPKQGAVL